MLFTLHPMPAFARPVLVLSNGTRNISVTRACPETRPCRRSVRMVAPQPTCLPQESQLLVGLIGSKQGRCMRETDRERVKMLVNDLESCRTDTNIDWPTNLRLLDGRWSLFYSSEPLPPLVVLPLGFLTLRTVGIEQRYDTVNRIVENVILLAVDMPWRRQPASAADIEVIVVNTFEVTAPDTVELQIKNVESRVRGLNGERMRALLPSIPVGRLLNTSEEALRRRRSSDVRTTFIGEHLRVARSSKGELRVFVRPTL